MSLEAEAEPRGYTFFLAINKQLLSGSDLKVYYVVHKRLLLDRILR